MCCPGLKDEQGPAFGSGGEHLMDISGLMCFFVMPEEDGLELREVWEDGEKTDDKGLLS